MKPARPLLACLSLLLLSAPAHAHDGGALMVMVAMMSAPILIVIFLPLCVMAGMAGRRWIAFGLYMAALVTLFALQLQSWYHPFGRLFPEPDWLQDRIGFLFLLIPPLDVLLGLVVTVVILYLALRDRSVPILRTNLPPAGNLLRGALFSVAAIALWMFVLFGPVVPPWIRMWPDGLRMVFTLVWSFMVPVALAFIAVRLFRGPAPRYRHSEESEAP